MAKSVDIAEVFKSPEEVILKMPLYSLYSIGTASLETLVRLEFYRGVIDAYCTGCRRSSTFRATSTLPTIADKRNPSTGKPPAVASSIEELLEGFKRNQVLPEPTSGLVKDFLTSIVNRKPVGWEYMLRERSFCTTLQCTRDEKHRLLVYFYIQGPWFRKIGQFPSLADLELNAENFGQYGKVLGKRAKELRTAIGLHAHGVGVGAFVYLRRIFEVLIGQAETEARNEPGWDEQAYAGKRMDERIASLGEAHLPKYIVESRGLYGILSVGVHELDEEECNRRFPVILSSIRIILNDAVRKREEAQERKKIAIELEKLKGGTTPPGDQERDL